MQSEAGSAQNVTALLHAWREGRANARDELMTIVYPQLRSLASRYMSGEKPSHTLSATGLVHEAYLKIFGSEVPWSDRVHFFAVSARVMRHILVDHAKANRRERRGGAAKKMCLEDAVVISSEPEHRLLDLDKALRNLSELDQRKADLVELLYFGGMSQAEAAEVLNISEATAQRDLRMATAWLYRALNQTEEARSRSGKTPNT
jgi:RNA polymerase sigma factor (TIGR02999 family)